jgi:hypothetical protein
MDLTAFARENEHGYREASSLEGPPLAPMPAYVQSDADALRWYAAAAIATIASRQLEPDGIADPRFVWLGARALYNDRTIPTGDADPGILAQLAEFFGDGGHA